MLRWCDAESENSYGLAKKSLRCVYDGKCSLIKNGRSSWPRYTKHDEDVKLRGDYWNERYQGHRVVQWDNTNVSIGKPSDARKQRATFSSYYGENCAKVGVFLQLCGWMGVHELWSGGVSDTEYLNKSGILEYQKQFALNDLSDEHNNVIAFLNALDKGYRSTVAAWRSGCQLTLQPDFVKPDRQFKAIETISSAAVATDRSANERAVRLSKQSKRLKSGLETNSSYDRLADTWIIWSFITNLCIHLFFEYILTI